MCHLRRILSILDNVDSYPYSGVQLDCKLRWKEHREYYNQCQQDAGPDKTKCLVLYRGCQENLVCNNCKTKLEYATSTCDPHYNCDVEKLERVQRSATRYCTGENRYTSCVTSIFQKLQLQPLEKRRKISRLTFLYKIVHNIVDVDKQSYRWLSKETRTRNSHKFKLPVPITE